MKSCSDCWIEAPTNSTDIDTCATTPTECQRHPEHSVTGNVRAGRPLKLSMLASAQELDNLASPLVAGSTRHFVVFSCFPPAAG